MNENKKKLRDAFKTFFSLGVEKVMEYEKNDELEKLDYLSAQIVQI
jgi:hypothetical protein